MLGLPVAGGTKICTPNLMLCTALRTAGKWHVSMNKPQGL